MSASAIVTLGRDGGCCPTGDHSAAWGLSPGESITLTFHNAADVPTILIATSKPWTEGDPK